MDFGLIGIEIAQRHDDFDETQSTRIWASDPHMARISQSHRAILLLVHLKIPHSDALPMLHSALIASSR